MLDDELLVDGRLNQLEPELALDLKPLVEGLELDELVTENDFCDLVGLAKLCALVLTKLDDKLLFGELLGTDVVVRVIRVVLVVGAILLA